MLDDEVSLALTASVVERAVSLRVLYRAKGVAVMHVAEVERESATLRQRKQRNVQIDRTVCQANALVRTL